MTVDFRLLLSEFTRRYRSRIRDGLETYGKFNPDTDTRCLSREAVEECLDVGSYLEMLEEKWPDLTVDVNRVRSRLILLYSDLRGLEDMERSLEKGGR